MCICFSIYLSISAISCQALATSPSPCHAHPFCLLLSLRHSLFRLVPSFTVNFIAPSIPPSFITSFPSSFPLSSPSLPMASHSLRSIHLFSLLSFPLFSRVSLPSSHAVSFPQVTLFCFHVWGYKEELGTRGRAARGKVEERRERWKREEGKITKGRGERKGYIRRYISFFPVSLLLYSRVSLPSSHVVSFQQMIVLFPCLRLQGEELGTRRSGRGQW